jgi:hypothetical protein
MDSELDKAWKKVERISKDLTEAIADFATDHDRYKDLRAKEAAQR